MYIKRTGVDTKEDKNVMCIEETEAKTVFMTRKTEAKNHM
jgi:hypothetical protein